MRYYISVIGYTQKGKTKMKNIKKITLAVVASALGISLCAPSTYAASNYNIVYSGGDNLGSANVTIDKALVDGLGNSLTTSGLTIIPPSGWPEGYVKYSGTCYRVKYTKVKSGDHAINTAYSISGKPNNTSTREYVTTVNIKNINFESTDTSKEVAVSIYLDSSVGNIDAGRKVFTTEAACTADGTSVTDALAMKSGEKIFVNTNLKTEYKDENDNNKLKTLKSDQMYFELFDIDGAQSYKIDTPVSNRLSKDNMFAASAETLQPNTTTSTVNGNTSLRNKFVTSANGNYIYSQYTTDQEGILDNHFDIVGGSNVFVRVNEEAQEQGIGMVFGYSVGAGSNIRFFAKQLKVTYDSDKNGVIKEGCLTKEEVVSGNNPFGSCSTPNEGYEFVYWIADKDVELENGSKIKKGEKMTPEQVKQVVVREEINFTAIHAPEPEEVVVEEVAPVKTPDTGASTSEMNAAQITLSIIGILAVALSVRMAPEVFHKKIKFD